MFRQSLGTGYFEFPSLPIPPLASGLTSVVISKNIKEIGVAAFAANDWLVTVEFEDPCSVHTIGNEAFAACGRLNKFEVPASVTTVGRWAFPEHWDAPID